MRFPAASPQPPLLGGKTKTVAFSWNSVVQHSPKDMLLRDGRGKVGKVSWQPLLGPVIVPERFFVARLLCRAMPARGWVAGGEPPNRCRFYFPCFLFFGRQASL